MGRRCAIVTADGQLLIDGKPVGRLREDQVMGTQVERAQLANKLYSKDRAKPERGLFDGAENPEAATEELMATFEERLKELRLRGNFMFSWAQGEYAIAKNVFPKGHKLRNQKLTERIALGNWIKDVNTLLDEFIGREEAW